MSIPIYDNFDDLLGRFSNYDTYDLGQKTQIARQNHVDIRSFEQTTLQEPYTMFDMDAMTMTQLDALTMQQLEGRFVIQEGENWTNGTVGPQSDRNNFNGISLSCSGSTTTQSIMQTTVNISSYIDPDYISLALPAFPLSSVTLGSTFLDLSADGFATVASLPFSGATLSATGGDYEARFSVSLVTGIDLTKINAVRFRITTSNPCTFRCLAIRAISDLWEYAPLDSNTLHPRLGATVPPSGSLSQTIQFPLAEGSITPSDWPILLRSDGDLGPTIVDVDMGVTIHAGSNTYQNTFTAYMRELPMIWTPMSSMDVYTMAQLEALPGMPDWSTSNLDDFDTAQSIEVTILWGPSNQIKFHDTITNQTYTYSFSGLEAHKDHYVLIQLEDDRLRARIFAQSVNGVIDWSNLIVDTTTLVDANFNRRRRGRLGWYAQLQEGDTYIKQFRPRRLVYSEYRSAPLASITPVVGAQIYASSTPDLELYRGVTNPTLPVSGVATVAPDSTKSNSGKSLRVTTDAVVPLEGLVTAPVTFESMTDAIITFDVLSPITTPLATVLRGEGRLIVLNMYPFPPNHWSHIEIPLELVGKNFIPGTYQLFIVQTITAANTFYVDNLSIRSQSISWQGRAPAPDPWSLNNPPWIKYGDEINSPYDGALLGRGNTLQIRGQALNQLGQIDQVKIIPKYDTLGNFIWSDEAPTYPSLPVPSFFTSTSAFDPNLVTFDGSATTFSTAGGFYRWDFGDGEVGYGEIVTHTYATIGFYIITLTAIDLLDQKVSVSRPVDIVEVDAPPGIIDAVAPVPTVT